MARRERMNPKVEPEKKEDIPSTQPQTPSREGPEGEGGESGEHGEGGEESFERMGG